MKNIPVLDVSACKIYTILDRWIMEMESRGILVALSIDRSIRICFVLRWYCTS